VLHGFMAPALLLVSFAAFAVARPEFVHLPSLLLTLGGSIVVVFCTYSPRQIRELFQICRSLLTEKSLAPQKYAEHLTHLTQIYRSHGLRGLEAEERRLADPFLRRSVSMLVDLQKEDKISAVLERELADVLCGHELSKQILLTLGKVLPAFGLIGTLVGMVFLLRDLYTQNVESLPAALSLSVLTTLYGAVFANVVVAPLAARIHAAATEKEMRMGMTFDWTMGIAKGKIATQNVAGLRSAVETIHTSRDRGWATLNASALR
jgi:chemotaxis protein MotA